MAQAGALSQLPGVSIKPDEVHTNIVMFIVDEKKGTGVEIEERLREAGLLCLALAGQKIRLVTHHDLSDDDINNAIHTLQKVLG